jgi:hypothetical protein
MIGNPIFKKHTTFPNKIDNVFVFMVDEMVVGKWYDASSYWDLVLQLYDANRYESGVEIALSESKKWKKITEETILKRIYEFKKQKNEIHNNFVNSSFFDELP